jgi:ABC-2 type transport system ATP-binding protein
MSLSVGVSATSHSISAPALLTARAISRHFGRRSVLSSVDVALLPGRVVGLIGPNGAGKSTLLSILAGHLRPSDGQVAWHVAGANGRLRGWLGMLPQGAPPPRQETPRGFFSHLAKLQHVADPTACAAEMLEAIGLGHRAKIRIRSLSEGERKLVAIGQAFLGAPRVVLLDEPTSALDPWGRQRLRALIRARRDAGAAVLLASHNLGEAEQVCDEAVVLVDGRVESTGALSTLLRAPREMRLEMGIGGTVPVEAIRAALAGGASVEFDADTRVLTLQATAPLAQAEQVAGATFRLLAEAGVEVRRVVYGRSLERALTSLVTRGRATADADLGIVRA